MRSLWFFITKAPTNTSISRTFSKHKAGVSDGDHVVVCLFTSLLYINVNRKNQLMIIPDAVIVDGMFMDFRREFYCLLSTILIKVKMSKRPQNIVCCIRDVVNLQTVCQSYFKMLARGSLRSVIVIYRKCTHTHNIPSFGGYLPRELASPLEPVLCVHLAEQ